MKRIKYQKCRVRSFYNRAIDLNLKILILTRFLTNFCFSMSGWRKLMLNIFKNGDIMIEHVVWGQVSIVWLNLIRTRFETKLFGFFSYQDQENRCWISTKMEKIKYQKHRVGFCVNLVFDLNQKMLILKRCVTKNDFVLWWWQLNCL